MSDSFPTATFGYQGGSFSQRSLLLQTTNDGHYLVGDAGFTVTTYYKPGLLHIPFNQPFLGTPRITSYISRAKINTSNINRYTRVSDTVQYLGYGSLTLNGNTRNNCVLIRHGRKISDTLGANPYNTSMYAWFTPNIGYPILQFTIERDGTATPNFVDNIVTSTQPKLQHVYIFNPNPATNQLTVGQTEAQTAVFTSALGTEMVLPITNGIVQLNGLAKGMYSVKVGTHTQRVVVD
jgi:hypothetical protein